ncbi:MAG TPA: hypothetical protein ENI86_18900 [Acidimicrobiales bacterium]|nr:hypothetical protein [Acidimicrobiales bacterium]
MSEESSAPRVAVLIKQVPVLDSMVLGSDGRLVRTGGLQMNDYCRRAVTTAVELARAVGGTVTSFTMGPDSAVDVLREAAVCGVDRGVHLNDPGFAGSDTLATAKALVAALRHQGGFEIVVTGMNSVDADTGQVPVQTAAILGLPVLTGVRRWSLSGEVLRADLEHDDLLLEVEAPLPVVISMAERSCDPCKHKDPRSWPAADDLDITVLRTTDLGPGPWGQAAGRTVVLGVESTRSKRSPLILRSADPNVIGSAVTHTVELLAEVEPSDGDRALPAPVMARSAKSSGEVRPMVVLAEAGRPQMTREIVDAARTLASESGAEVVVVTGDEAESRAAVPSCRLMVSSGTTPEEFHSDIESELIEFRPSIVIAPSTPWGREVASRLAVSLDAGLTGDVIGIEPTGPERVPGSAGGNPDPRRPDPGASGFVALKPAFGGGMLARIGYTSPTALATVRRGALVPREPVDGTNRAGTVAATTHLPERGVRGRVRVVRRVRVDDNSDLFSSRVILGVGQGVPASSLPRFEGWASRLGAALGATRKVTDAGWLPRSRQIGITAHSVSPDLYLAVGVSGRETHLSGVRGARVVLAVNPDPLAPIFESCDVGIVARWEDVMEELVALLTTTEWFGRYGR